ncbi:MAG TPA: aminotransferase class I/II-fold pyridoxal phosphate-dependent enzyme [Pyrinomonadaceae bacterium]|nr:aminotransferase class I/II-fold pyridoxal phosphate-dependent enzyme [Pyrinomonadaceae bacterium]
MTDEFENDGTQTKVIHASRTLNSTSAVNAPIWQTTTFRAESSEHFVELAKSVRPSEFYTRYGNPSHGQVETTVAALEGGEAALVTGSGMGAIFAAVVSHLRAGDHLVAQRDLYAGTKTLFEDYLPRWNIECTYVDQTDPGAFAAAVRPNTKMLYAETPSNPLMRLTDLRAVAEVARSRGLVSVVDNTFATPLNQRPLELGIDVVVHSATKYLGGHHDVTAGVVVSTRERVEQTWHFQIIAGSALSPFEGWLLLRGLRTLGVRVREHNRNALALARFLETHPKVERVYYPGLESHPQHELARQQMSGFTGVFSVELRGGYAAADRFIRSLRLATYAPSLGGFETLVVHPAAMWGLQLSADEQTSMGIGAGLVRVSVGIEDEPDLLADFKQALEKA